MEAALSLLVRDDWLGASEEEDEPGLVRAGQRAAKKVNGMVVSVGVWAGCSSFAVVVLFVLLLL